jgi:NADH:ubiquinone oxidoreductase subunit F (NADH-binding)
MFEPVLTANINRPDSEKIAVYQAHGGYEAARKAHPIHSEELIDIVKRSGCWAGAGRLPGASNGLQPGDRRLKDYGSHY